MKTAADRRRSVGDDRLFVFRHANRCQNARMPLKIVYAEDDVPADQKPFIALNVELSKVWKPIVERKPAPADADQWKDVKPKAHLLEK